MSSLVFYTDANNIVVATDTLAVTPAGDPFMFSSKAIYLPHLRTIIAGTGAGSFSGDWAMYINNRMILEGIENLNYHATEGLKVRWDEFKSHQEVPENMTTTVYHFGFSEDNAVTAFAYRSTNDFASERLPKGFGIKPPSALPEGAAIFSIFEQIVRKQRVEQDALPPDARIYIGGAVYCIHLTCDECKTVRLFAFDDQKDHQLDMNARHARGE